MARPTAGGGVIQFQPVTEANQQQLLALLADNPMAGLMDTVMARGPNYMVNQHYFGNETAYLAEESGNIVGCYQLTQHQGFVNGALTTLGYLNSLRVMQNYRQKIRVLKAGFKHLAHSFALPDYCYTSIASDNHSAQRILEKGIQGLPHYHYLGELYTLLISKQHQKNHHAWAKVAQSQQKAWVAFYNGSSKATQLAPYVTESWLAQSGLTPLGVYEKGALQASSILWNQLAFKQVKVVHYHSFLKAVRHLYNGYACLTKRPRLPKCYDAIPQSFLAFLQYQAHQPLIPLIEDALHLCQTPLLTCSLGEHHPSLPEIIGRFKPFVYRTKIYRVDFKDTPLWQDYPFHLEAAIL